MNIKVSDLKRFQKLSSHIRPTGILPASDCIRFGDGLIIKNAHSSFVAYDCKDSDTEVLVDEHALYSLVNITRSEFINIAVKDTKLIISDGKDKIPCGMISIKEFPITPNHESPKQPISPEFLESLGRASETCADYKGNETTLYMFVHVGNKMMAAGSGFMGVCFPIEEDYKMVIEKRTANFVSKIPFTDIAESDGHYFFYGNSVVMGFSKQEIGFAEFGKMINGGDTLTFSIDAADVLSFNSLAMSLSKDFGLVTMKDGEFESENSFQDAPNTRPQEGLKLPEPFTYNAEQMNKVITALGVEVLDFYYSPKSYYIKSTETKATAIIAKISKP